MARWEKPNLIAETIKDFITCTIRKEGRDCSCEGSGWILSDYDTWHQCPEHFQAKRPHPEE